MTKREEANERLEATARREIDAYEAHMERRWLQRVGYALRRVVAQVFDSGMPQFRRTRAERKGTKGERT